MKFKIRIKLWQVAVGFFCLAMTGFVIYSILHAINGNVTKSVAKEAASPKDESHYLRPLFFFFYIIFYFYFTINYYYWLIADNKKFLDYVKVTALLTLGVFVYHSFLYFQLPQALQGKYDSLGQMLGVMFKNMIPMLIMSFVFAYIIYLWESKKQRQILEAQKLQLENQISQANFNFLKAQINPHFLHNTLNFLYAKSLPYSPELSEGILTLSDIMRYALNQGYQKEGKAPLKDEIEHVHNVIKISQLRFSDQLKVNFEVKGDPEGYKIIPFVLITIVENAFKHGDLRDPAYPLELKLEVRNGGLWFYCRNKKKRGPKETSTGIGLDNIRKRLFMAYGDQYKFSVKEDPEFYSIELIINKL